MLAYLKGLLQAALLWLLMFINGGQLPPELLPPDLPDFSNIDWSSFFDQQYTSNPWQVTTSSGGEAYDLAAKRAKAARQVRSQSSLDLADSAAGSSQLAMAMPSSSGASALNAAGLAASMGGLPLTGSDSGRIVNPSGAPRSALGSGVAAWTSKGSTRRTTDLYSSSPAAEPAPAEDRSAMLGLIGLGAAGLAVAGYIVVRRNQHR